MKSPVIYLNMFLFIYLEISKSNTKAISFSSFSKSYTEYSLIYNDVYGDFKHSLTTWPGHYQTSHLPQSFPHQMWMTLYLQNAWCQTLFTTVQYVTSGRTLSPPNCNRSHCLNDGCLLSIKWYVWRFKWISPNNYTIQIFNFVWLMVWMKLK